MVKRITLITTCLLALATTVIAQGPNNSGTYYRNADGKCGKELKTALYNIIKEPKVTSYSGLKDAYKKTDTRPDGYLRDWYSNATKYTPGSSFGSGSGEGQGYNREHTIPQSWFAEASPMKSDIVHVVPTDAAINGMRSDFPFGETDPNKTKYKESKNGYSKFGYSKTPGYSGLVFEPNDEVKGDLARIYFYMATCYENQVASWDNASGGTVISGDSYQPYVQWTFEMLMRWSQLDPVDSIERARNVAAYGVQKNRNPFVDYPGLESYIWGKMKEVPFSYNNYEQGDTIKRVETPFFTPEEGLYNDSVIVTIASATEGATIYYTINGSDVTVGAATVPAGSSQAVQIYTEPIILKATTTLKAIAVKDGMFDSRQATATYRVKKHTSGEGETMEITFALNNSSFGTSYNGALPTGDKQDLTATADGVTVTYALGSGTNRYCNNSQIRLYQKNQLIISTTEGVLTAAEFTKAGDSKKTIQASVGTVDGLSWTGEDESVVFTVNDGSGNLPLSSVKVTLLIPGETVEIPGDVNGD